MGESETSKKLLIISVLFCLFFNFYLAPKAAAAEVRMQMSILPVRFVYVGNDGNISHIWSNVAAESNVYKLKFFSAKTKQEIDANERFFAEFKTSLQETSWISTQNWRESLAVEFVKEGGSLEEIRTYT